MSLNESIDANLSDNSESLNLSPNGGAETTQKGVETVSGEETLASSVVSDAFTADDAASVETSRTHSRRGCISKGSTPSGWKRQGSMNLSSRGNGSGNDLGSLSYSNLITKSGSIADPSPILNRSADGSLVKYQGGLKQSKSWMSNETIMTCDFNCNGRHLALGHKDGSIAIFDTATGTKLYENRLDKTTNLCITSLNFLDKYKKSEQNILLSTYSPGYTALWHVTSGNLLAKISEDRQVLASAVDPTCSTFCTTGYDCSLRIYNCDSLCHQATLDSRMTGHVSRVFGVTYHPQSPNELISAGWDGTIQFWDLRKNGSIRNISGTMVCGNSISINPVNFSIATGSWRPKEAVQIWDYDTARLVKTIEPNFDTKVYSLQWMNGNLLVAGGAQSNNVVVVDAEKGMITGSMSGFKSGIYGVAYTPEYRNTIAIVSGESCQLAVWKERPFMGYPIIPFEQKYK